MGPAGCYTSPTHAPCHPASPHTPPLPSLPSLPLSAENIKKWALPDGDFLHNFLSQQRAIVNSMALNADGVMATGGLAVGGGRA